MEGIAWCVTPELVTSDLPSLDPLLSIPSPAWSDIYYHPALPSDADIDYSEMMGEW